MRAPRILALARTSRCAMVGTGTRNACAISSVERPPSVRRVRATCASVASAGWQHVKIRQSLSSGTDVSSSADSSRWYAISSCFCTRRARRRRPSIALCRAVDTSQATGFAGVPAPGHRSIAVANASWSASSATSKSPSRRMRVARIRPCSARKISSRRMAAWWKSYSTGRQRARDRLLWRAHPNGPHLDRVAPAQQRVAGRDRERLVEVLDFDDAVAAQLLLGLGERAIGRDRLAVLQPHGRGGAGQVQRIAGLKDAVPSEALAELDSLVVDRLPFLLRHLSPQLLVPVHEQHVTHVRCPFSGPSLPGSGSSSPAGP